MSIGARRGHHGRVTRAICIALCGPRQRSAVRLSLVALGR